MRRIGCVFFLLFFPTFCFAGGGDSKASIKNFDASGASIEFTLKCVFYKVHVKHQSVPWYSWLPFVRSSHSTFSDSQKTIAYLKRAFKDSEPVNFGYIGHGLKQSNKPCEYSSKGLILDETDEFHYIISYHNPL